MADIEKMELEIENTIYTFVFLRTFEFRLSCSHWGCVSASGMWNAAEQHMRRPPDGRFYEVF